MARPSVSVLLPVRNGFPFLVEALASLYAQSRKDWEWVLVDDGSTDGTQRWLQQLAREEDRIRLVASGGRGITAALQRGLTACRAPFIARMDADDLCHPHRLARQLDFLDRHPDVVAVGCWTLSIDADGDPIATSRWKTSHEKILAQLLVGCGGLPHPGAVMRRDALESIGGYRQDLTYAQDKDLWLRLAEIGRLANLPDVLLYYREHPSSISQKDRARQQKDLIRVVKEARAARGLPELQTFRDEEQPQDEPATTAFEVDFEASTTRLAASRTSEAGTDAGGFFDALAEYLAESITPELRRHAGRFGDTVREWIRRARRAGNYATARKHLGRLPPPRTLRARWEHRILRWQLARRRTNRDRVPRFALPVLFQRTLAKAAVPCPRRPAAIRQAS